MYGFVRDQFTKEYVVSFVITIYVSCQMCKHAAQTMDASFAYTSIALRDQCILRIIQLITLLIGLY